MIGSGRTNGEGHGRTSVCDSVCVYGLYLNDSMIMMVSWYHVELDTVFMKIYFV